MRIATYNIMSGGFNSYQPQSRVPVRLGKLVTAIKYIRADFLGLTDTYLWQEIYSNKDLRNIFGYKNSFHLDLDDVRVPKKIGVAVLTNLPVIQQASLRLKTRNCIRSTIRYKGKEIDLFTVYLDDLSEEVRLTSIKALLDNLAPRPTIILGDFNAVAPGDVDLLEKEFKILAQTNHNLRQRSDPASYITTYLRNLAQAKVTRLLASSGFVEASGNCQPTALTLIHPWKMKRPIFRVDHIFHTKDLKSKGLKVWKTVQFETASDHYPVSAEIA